MPPRDIVVERGADMERCVLVAVGVVVVLGVGVGLAMGFVGRASPPPGGSAIGCEGLGAFGSGGPISPG
jgi:hypothetical protein